MNTTATTLDRLATRVMLVVGNGAAVSAFIGRVRAQAAVLDAATTLEARYHAETTRELARVRAAAAGIIARKIKPTTPAPAADAPSMDDLWDAQRALAEMKDARGVYWGLTRALLYALRVPTGLVGELTAGVRPNAEQAAELDGIVRGAETAYRDALAQAERASTVVRSSTAEQDVRRLALEVGSWKAAAGYVRAQVLRLNRTALEDMHADHFETPERITAEVEHAISKYLTTPNRRRTAR